MTDACGRSAPEQKRDLSFRKSQPQTSVPALLDGFLRALSGNQFAPVPLRPRAWSPDSRRFLGCRRFSALACQTTNEGIAAVFHSIASPSWQMIRKMPDVDEHVSRKHVTILVAGVSFLPTRA